MQKNWKRISALLLTAVLLFSVLGMNASAYLGRITSASGVTASVSGSGTAAVGTLKNEWVSMELFTASGLPAYTLKPCVTRDGATYGQSRLSVRCIIDGTSSLVSELSNVSIKKDSGTLVYQGDFYDGRMRLRVIYELMNIDCGSLEYSGDTYVPGTTVGDDGSTWGVLVTVQAEALKDFDEMLYVETELWATNFGANAHQVGSSIYLDQFTSDTGAGVRTDAQVAVANEMGDTATNAQISDSCRAGYAEVCTADFAYANEFLALGGYVDWMDYQTHRSHGVEGHDKGYYLDYAEYVSIVNAGNERKGSQGKILNSPATVMLKGDDRGEFECGVQGFDKVIAFYLQGYRDLVPTSQADKLPEDPTAIAIPKNSTALGIVYANSKYNFVQGSSRSALVSAYGKQLAACFEGAVKVSGNTATFGGDAAMLDPGVKATWTTGGITLTIAPDGKSVSSALTGVSLSSPSYTFFRPKADGGLNFVFEKGELTVEIDPDCNKAMLQFDIPGAAFKLSTLKMNNGTLEFGGLMSINTSVMNFADLSVQRLQLQYSNGKYRMTGIQASGAVDFSSLGTFVTAAASADINTFGSNEYYKFSLSVDARLFSGNASLDLVRLKSGALVPDNLAFDFSSPVGISLPPTVPVVMLTGAGAGFNDLAKTLDRAYSGLPPINITVSATGKLLGIIDGTASVTIGPTMQRVALTDGRILTIPIINEYSMTLSDNYITQYDSKGNAYQGIREEVKWKLELGIPKGADNSVVTAGASYGWNLFTGVNVANKAAMLSVGADGTIEGKVKLPSGWPVIGGMTLLEKTFNLSLGGTAVIGLDKTDASYTSNYNLYAPKLKEINGKGSVSTTFGIWEFKVKVAYNFGDNKVTISKGKPVRVDNVLLAETDYDTDGTLNGFFTVGSNVIQVTPSANTRAVVQPDSVTGAALTQGADEAHYTATVEDGRNPADYLLEITPKDGVIDRAFIDGLTVTDGSKTLTLKVMKTNPDATSDSDVYLYNAANPTSVENMTDTLALGAEKGTVNCLLSDSNTLVTDHSDRESLLLCVSEADMLDWSNVSVSGGEDFDIGFLYAEQDAAIDAASVGDETLSYTLANTDSSSAYLLRLYYVDGTGEQTLMAEETAAASGDIALPYEGTALPDGDYEIKAVLVERHYTEIEGETYENWEVIHESDCGTIHYSNAESPAALNAVTLKFDGDESVLASWSASAGGCDGYSVELLQKTEDGLVSTGVSTATQDTSVRLRVTGGTSTLEADQTYAVCVTPYYLRLDGDTAETTYVYGGACRSNAVYVAKENPAELTVEPTPDTESNMLPVNTETVTLRADSKATFCVMLADDTTAVAAPTQISSTDTTSEWALPTDFDGAVTFVAQCRNEQGDTTETYFTLIRDDEAPYLQPSAATFAADGETGDFTISGITERGAEVRIEGMDDIGLTATVTADAEDGTFTYSGNVGTDWEDELRTSIYLQLTAVKESGLTSSCFVTVALAAPHTWSEEYTYDENGHWYTCTEEDCEEINGYEPHTLLEADIVLPTCVTAGYTELRCVCGYTERTNEILALGHDYVDGVCSRCGAEDPNAKDPCEGYTDINRNSWYHSAADYVIKNGYMGSTKTDSLVFEPNTKVSRAMVASIMYRIAGSPDVEYKGSFTDVQSGKWFTAAIEWAAQNGLASGKGAGKFDPNGNVTRQELAVFMYKLSEHLGNDVTGRADLSAFADAASVPAWAKSFVEWAVDAGLISGKSNNGVTKLAPVDNATRAEFASIIMRFMSKPV